MEHFNVLPTDPRFQALSYDQIEFIFKEYELEMEDAKRQQSNKEQVGYYADEDDSWFTETKFDPAAKVDEADIDKQAQAMMTDEARKNAEERMKYALSEDNKASHEAKDYTLSAIRHQMEANYLKQALAKQSGTSPDNQALSKDVSNKMAKIAPKRPESIRTTNPEGSQDNASETDLAVQKKMAKEVTMNALKAFRKGQQR